MGYRALDQSGLGYFIHEEGVFEIRDEGRSITMTEVGHWNYEAELGSRGGFPPQPPHHRTYGSVSGGS